MYKVKPNIGKNRLELYLKGQVWKEELNDLYTDVRFGVADLSKDFDVITDLSECEMGSLSALETLRKITNFLIEKNVKSIVRIINEKQLISTQMYNYEGRKTGLKILYANNQTEAEELLSQTEKRNGLRFKLIGHTVDYTIGTGVILDISSTGCAIEGKTSFPTKSQEVKITIQFSQKEGLIDTFSCTAYTMWVDGEVFALQFKDLEDDQADKLHKRLAYECK